MPRRWRWGRCHAGWELRGIWRGVGREAWGRAQGLSAAPPPTVILLWKWCEDLRRSCITLNCMDTAKEGSRRGGRGKAFSGLGGVLFDGR
jgi:hypothetical protein